MQVSVIISMLIVGLGGFSGWASMEVLASSPQREQPQGFFSIASNVGEWRFGYGDPPGLDSPRLFTQRRSSQPAGESRTGRASSAPSSGMTDSNRGSSISPEVIEDRSKHTIVDETEKEQGAMELAPKKSRDPSEGGGETPSRFHRRGGVRQ